MKDVDFFTPGARLALELECLLMDTRNDAAQSRWWDSAHEALEQWRQAVREMEQAIEADHHPDSQAVDRFAAAMKEKLAQARAKGRSGWQNLTSEELSRMLREHVEKGDPLDVANFCMFLWNLGHGIGAEPAQAAAFSEAASNHSNRYQQSPMLWQPIETAPKDATWILVWRRHSNRAMIVKWDPQYEEFEDTNGDHVYSVLTHWMPLPSSPDEAPKREPLTEEQLASACLWYRHDFGLMDDAQRQALMAEAARWALAFGKSIEFSRAAPPTDKAGDVVVTWNASRTRIIAVTRQDEEGRVLKLIAEAPAAPQADDEPLLRQALEALGRAHQKAMEQTLKARIPECAEFAGIAQDLDFVIAALRERLGVKA